MNRKGFTLVELIASFSLAIIMMFFLFQIVIAVKELYVSSGLKTEMLIRQANMERAIGTDLKDDTITTIITCGDECYQINYGSGASKTLKVDHTKNTIAYGDYQISMLDGSTLGTLTITEKTVTSSAGKNNTIVIIDFPVTNKLAPNRNFGIHLIYQYDNRTTNLGL